MWHSFIVPDPTLKEYLLKRADSKQNKNQTELYFNEEEQVAVNRK